MELSSFPGAAGVDPGACRALQFPVMIPQLGRLLSSPALGFVVPGARNSHFSAVPVPVPLPLGAHGLSKTKDVGHNAGQMEQLRLLPERHRN